MCWHTLTLDVEGPRCDERDAKVNPFLDYRFDVLWSSPDGQTRYRVPGYFAADGDAANTSATQGSVWRSKFVPNVPGRWSYQTRLVRGDRIAVGGSVNNGGSRDNAPNNGQGNVTDHSPNQTDQHQTNQHQTDQGLAVQGDGVRGTIEVAPTDKSRPDLRAEGRLGYVGSRYLRFAGSGRYFLKIGADAPETLLGYQDFDGTVAGKPDRVPLKRYASHLKDWRAGDPTWKDGRGKGLIGAINYLSSTGCNAFSFLTYNAGGDGDNVWPMIERNDKTHYDCSKLDQWDIVFTHGTNRGMYLHFKLQETENDDNRRGKNNKRPVAESLDGGKLGVERKLYLREIVARFGHHLALNWNLGEENTQTHDEQVAMIDYIRRVDPYDHPIVLHTYPRDHDKVYGAFLGDRDGLTGLSMQNDALKPTHQQTVRWVRRSSDAGHPWVVAFDESGSAAHAQSPDLGYRGFDGHDKDGKATHTQHEVRKQTLWGHLIGGGGGCEYYFGYKYVENDLVCEDWRSRDASWRYGSLAINFFERFNIPFWEMNPSDESVGNRESAFGVMCLAKPGDTYVIYRPEHASVRLNLTDLDGDYEVRWFNPRNGGELRTGSESNVSGGTHVDLGNPPSESDDSRLQDWVILVRRVAKR